MPNNNVVDRFNVNGEEFHIEPILDSVPTQGSLQGVTSGGVFADKSNVPIKDGTKNFTSGGAFDFFGGLTDVWKWLKTMFTPMMVACFRRPRVVGASVNMQNVTGVCYHDGLYVAVTYNDTPVAGIGIWYAEEDNDAEFPNDANFGVRGWHQSNITQGYAQGASPIYHNGTWVATLAGSNDVKGIYWSTDGKTWTRSDFTTYSVTHFAAYGNVIAAMCGYTSVGLIYSEDGGRTWHQSNITSYSGSAGPLFCRDGMWLANFGGTYYHSTNGKEWTVATTPPPVGPARFFERAKSISGTVLYVTGCAGSDDKKGIYVSADNGDTWTRISDVLQTQAISAPMSAGDEYVFCYGGANNGFIQIRADGYTEAGSGSVVGTTVCGMCFIPYTGIFCAVGSGGVHYNTKVASFTTAVSNLTGSYSYGEIRYVDGVFLLASASAIRYSTDFGITWVDSRIDSTAYGKRNHFIIGKKSIVCCGGFSELNESGHYGGIVYAQLKEALKFYIGQES